MHKIEVYENLILDVHKYVDNWYIIQIYNFQVILINVFNYFNLFKEIAE